MAKTKTKTPKKRGPGRPAVNDPALDHRFMTRCTGDDETRWRALAAKEGFTSRGRGEIGPLVRKVMLAYERGEVPRP